jgi:hypothetical protein
VRHIRLSDLLEEGRQKHPQRFSGLYDRHWATGEILNTCDVGAIAVALFEAGPMGGTWNTIQKIVEALADTPKEKRQLKYRLRALVHRNDNKKLCTSENIKWLRKLEAKNG